ncbi:hypothetical protein [Lysinibacillus sphaericus]|uniref:hypothetical protein n=1 Tax=Lysinibacillus sphaericus TaxID=1421 RepID=UPI00055F58FF|nr:hypothetical protein [Lysinibacillus sphaericus]MBG9693665.1 hypothetical protein [Lysinibacillus sphaericus]MBG9754903.1 hypothetical protein [Lysinibacillus sphaericus]QTB15400.1 hypothetical protein J2B92_09525 [Lysinibacillus sphaericus]
MRWLIISEHGYKKYKIYPESERYTAVFLLASVLVWGIYDRVTTGKMVGAPWYIIISTSVFNTIIRSYYARKEKRKKLICNDGPFGCSPYQKQVLVRLLFDFGLFIQLTNDRYI